jgi:hypothetical protein
MSKLFTKIINTCKDCPGCIETNFGDDWGPDGTPFCCHKPIPYYTRELDLTSIPEWCPLPDN